MEGCFPRPIPCSFFKETQQFFWPCPRQAPGRRAALVPECPAIPWAFRAGGPPGTGFPWEGALIYSRRLNPSLFHHVRPSSSKPLTGMRPSICHFLGVRKPPNTFPALWRVQRVPWRDAVTVLGNFGCNSVRSPGCMFSHFFSKQYVTEPRF